MHLMLARIGCRTWIRPQLSARRHLPFLDGDGIRHDLLRIGNNSTSKTECETEEDTGTSFLVHDPILPQRTESSMTYPINLPLILFFYQTVFQPNHSIHIFSVFRLVRDHDDGLVELLVQFLKKPIHHLR